MRGEGERTGERGRLRGKNFFGSRTLAYIAVYIYIYVCVWLRKARSVRMCNVIFNLYVIFVRFVPGTRCAPASDAPRLVDSLARRRNICCLSFCNGRRTTKGGGGRYGMFSFLYHCVCFLKCYIVNSVPRAIFAQDTCAPKCEERQRHFRIEYLWYI